MSAARFTPSAAETATEAAAVMAGRAEIRRRAAAWAVRTHQSETGPDGITRWATGASVEAYLASRRELRQRRRREQTLVAAGVDAAAAPFLAREPLACDPAAFGAAQAIIEAETAAGFLPPRSEFSRWPAGWHPTGHYGLAAADVRRAWLAAGCRDSGKFRRSIRMALWSCAAGTSIDPPPPAPRKRDRYGDLCRIERGYRAWISAAAHYSRTGLHASVPPITRKALWTLGALSPVGRGMAVRRLRGWAAATVGTVGREQVWAAVCHPASIEAETECLRALGEAIASFAQAKWRAFLACQKAETGRLRLSAHGLGIPAGWAAMIALRPKLGIKALRWSGQSGQFFSPSLGTPWDGLRLAAAGHRPHGIYAVYDVADASQYLPLPPVSEEEHEHGVLALVEAGGEWHQHEGGWTAHIAVIREIAASTAAGLEIEARFPDLVVRYAAEEGAP